MSADAAYTLSYPPLSGGGRPHVHVLNSEQARVDISGLRTGLEARFRVASALSVTPEAVGLVAPWGQLLDDDSLEPIYSGCMGFLHAFLLDDDLSQLRAEGHSRNQLLLGHRRLASLPESICQLPDLQHLQLQGNFLTKLPENFGELATLKVLNLSQNQLVELPGNFGQLVALCFLYLQDNSLTSLPESFGQLEALQHLNLEHNRLKRLPKTFVQLKMLQVLRLDDNELTCLPAGLDQLSLLRVATVDQNPLVISADTGLAAAVGGKFCCCGRKKQATVRHGTPNLSLMPA